MRPPSAASFETLVVQALDSLPADIRHFFENVAITVEDEPNESQCELEGEGELLGLYEGVPRVDRDGQDPLLPDRITLFRKPLAAVCEDQAELERQVLVTLWHEIGHHLGFGEERLDDIEERILSHLNSAHPSSTVGT